MKFKKILSVLGGALLVGSSMGVAFAHTYPTPFVQDGHSDVAIVYGAGSAPTDLTAAQSIESNLKSVFDSFDYSSMMVGNFSNSKGVTENEVFLGTELKNPSNGDMRITFTDNQVPSLIDEKLRWDDGVNTKTSFNVHEEILLGGMKLLTTLDDKDLEGVALTNDKDLEYRYVFEDTLNTSRIGNDDAETLKISILGKEYDVEEFESDSITVSSSSQEVLASGESLIVDGVTITVEDIFEDTIQVNDVFIKEGHTGTVDGLKVQVESIAYHSSETLQSKVILKVGKEISTTYYDGDSYPGEDEEDPMWVWVIDNPGQNGGYIGVKYDLSQTDSDDDLVYEGESYTFPENYASVEFKGLTNVDYETFKLSFDDSKDLYEANDSNMRMYPDAKVLVLSGDAEDSFSLEGGLETDEVYLKYNLNEIIIQDSLELTQKDLTTWQPIVTSDNITINYTVKGDNFYVEGVPSEHTLIYYPNTGVDFATNVENAIVLRNGDNAIPSLPLEIDVGDSFCTTCDGAKLWLIPGNEATALEKLNNWDASEFYFETDLITYTNELVSQPVVEVFYNDVNKDYSSSVKPRYAFTFNGTGKVGDLVYEDTEFEMVFNSTERTLTIGDLVVRVNPMGDFEYLGSDDLDSEDDELYLNGKEVGDLDEDVLGYYGLILYDSKSNAEEDEVVLGVPSEQVFATVSVLGQGTDVVEEVPQFGTVLVTDSEIASVSGKNLIVVGGSCINTATAKILGVPENTCGEAFTSATGIGSGEYLLEQYVSPYNSDKVAIVVAGYEATDTVNGVNTLLA